MKYALFLDNNFCTTEHFEGPINVGDKIVYGMETYQVYDKDVDLSANCYDLYIKKI